jgi:hypothetical protein
MASIAYNILDYTPPRDLYDFLSRRHSKHSPHYMSFLLDYFPGNLVNLYKSQIIAGNIKLLAWMRQLRISAECLCLR